MTFKYENQKRKQGFIHIIGCDEVGRGCLAGPVVAAAVALPKTRNMQSEMEKWSGVRDSKLLSPKKREILSAIIKDNCLAWRIGIVSEKIIDYANIHNATLQAMRQAVENLMASFPGVILRPRCNSGAEESQTSKRSFARDVNALEWAQDDAAKRVLVAIDGKFTIPDFVKATSDKKASSGKPNFNIEQEAVIDGDNKILSIAAASIIAKVFRDNLMRQLHQQYPIYNFAQHKGYGTLFHRTMILKNCLSTIHRRSFCKNLAI